MVAHPVLQECYTSFITGTVAHPVLQEWLHILYYRNGCTSYITGMVAHPLLQEWLHILYYKILLYYLIALFRSYLYNINFENQTINKDFTRTFVNKHKMNRCSFSLCNFSDKAVEMQTMKECQTKVRIKSLFVVQFKKFKVVQTAWKVRDLMETE